MIHQVAIKTLPQEWLWCETWCDDASKRYAKTIDLVGILTYSYITRATAIRTVFLKFYVIVEYIFTFIHYSVIIR